MIEYGQEYPDTQSDLPDAPPEDVAQEEEKAGGRVSAATRLVKLAERRYELGCTPDGEPFAVPLTGPPIVRMLRGGRGSLRAELAQAYYAETGAAASQSALADACAVIEGKAAQAEPVELHLRVAAAGRETYVLDLGDQTGRAVVITPAGWQVVDTPPILFRRTALTGPLPEPSLDGTLDDLWSLLNVRETYRPVLAAFLVAALLPHVPHPILTLAGEQGAGKTTAAKIIASILDAAPAPIRKAPRDLDTWTTAAAGSWVVALDNLSSVPEWLSDALCRASTGDGDVRRRLYSDGDLHVIAFRRVVLLNGIDLGALRDDLADRLVTVHLDRITDRRRHPEAAVAEQWQQAHPSVLGAVLDLAVRVLVTLPTVHLAELPRMADFAIVLAAVDQVLSTDGLGTYLGLRAELAEDALNSDSVLGAIARAITGPWTGTAAELLAAIAPDEDQRLPKDWPRTAVALRGRLKRRAPSLRRLGWTVEDAEPDGHAKVKRTRLIPPNQRGGVQDARNPRNLRAGDVSADQVAGVDAGVCGGSAGVAGVAPRAPHNPRNNPRASTPTLTSANTPDADVAEVAGQDSPSSLVCDSCGAPLLLNRPGRTTCERCRLDRRKAAS